MQLIVDQVLNNETSLVGLTTIRDYDEYTFTHSVNVCIFSVALGKKLGFSKLQLYDLGMTALLHDVGKARVPVGDPQQDRPGSTSRSGGSCRHHPWLGALTLFAMRAHDELPYRSYPRGARASHEDRPDRVPQDASGTARSGIFSRIVAVADGFDAATTRRSYQTVPIEPDQVLARDVAEPQARL